MNSVKLVSIVKTKRYANNNYIIKEKNKQNILNIVSIVLLFPPMFADI